MGERDKITGRNAVAMDKDRAKTGGSSVDKKPNPTAVKSEPRESTPRGPRKSPKKRRKVNHGTSTPAPRLDISAARVNWSPPYILYCSPFSPFEYMPLLFLGRNVVGLPSYTRTRLTGRG